MSKRFFDTDKYNRPWFRDLSPAEKCAWDYITARCDNVGVWIPDYKGAEFCIGDKVDWDSLPNKCHDNIIILEDGKWWLSDFCSFQYGNLSECNKIQTSYINLLKRHGLYEIYLARQNGDSKGLASPLQGANKKTRQEKEKDKDKRGELRVYGQATPVLLSDDEMEKLLKCYTKLYIDQYIERMSLWEPKNGKRHKDDYKALLRWMAKDNVPKRVIKPKCPLCGEELIDGTCRNAKCETWLDK